MGGIPNVKFCGCWKERACERLLGRVSPTAAGTETPHSSQVGAKLSFVGTVPRITSPGSPPLPQSGRAASRGLYTLTTYDNTS